MCTCILNMWIILEMCFVIDQTYTYINMHYMLFQLLTFLCPRRWTFSDRTVRLLTVTLGFESVCSLILSHYLNVVENFTVMLRNIC